MDTMKIKSGLFGTVASKLIQRAIKKKTGYDILVDIQSLEVANGEENAKVHIETDLYCTRQQLEIILNKLGF